MNDSNRAWLFVAVAIVALCSIITLGLVWGLGVRVEQHLVMHGSVLPAAMEWAIQLRTAMTVFALANLGFAVLVVKRTNAVSLLASTISVHVLLNGFYLWFLSVPYATPY